MVEIAEYALEISVHALVKSEVKKKKMMMMMMMMKCKDWSWEKKMMTKEEVGGVRLEMNGVMMMMEAVKHGMNVELVVLEQVSDGIYLLLFLLLLLLDLLFCFLASSVILGMLNGAVEDEVEISLRVIVSFLLLSPSPSSSLLLRLALLLVCGPRQCGPSILP